MIPKIIHQTWKNNIIPDNWSAAVESCKSKHADYQYILWTDEMLFEYFELTQEEINFINSFISDYYEIDFQNN